MDNPLARWLLGVFGAAVVLFGMVVRSPGFAWIGLATIALTFIGFALSELTVNGKGMTLKLRDKQERDAAASTAGSESAVAELDATINSDDESPPTPSELDGIVAGALNMAAGQLAIEGILSSAGTNPLLAGCDLRLYIVDKDDGQLAPVGMDSSATRWAIGRGATGVAYEQQKYVLATGSSVCDDTYGLNAEQQARYQRLTAVASAPIFNSGGEVIGVLTAATEDEGSRLVGQEATMALVMTSMLLGRVLIELLQWFDDGRQ